MFRPGLRPARRRRRGGLFGDDPKSWLHAAPPGPAVSERSALPPTRGRSYGGGRQSGNPLEASEGAALLTRAGVACNVSDGRMVSSSGRAATYELACRGGFGWLVLRSADDRVSAFDCLTLATSSQGERHCVLPANRSQLGGLQAVADKAKTGCTVRDGIWLGTGGTPPISRYEAVCVSGAGYIFDIPAPGVKADLTVTDCKDADAFGLKCTLSAPTTGKG